MRKQLLTQVRGCNRLLLTSLLLLAISFTTNAQSILDDYVATVTYISGTTDGASFRSIPETRYVSNGATGNATHLVFAQSFTTGADVTTPQIVMESGGDGTGVAVAVNAGNLEFYVGTGNDVELTISGITASTQYSYIFFADSDAQTIDVYLQSGTLDPTTLTTGSSNLTQNALFDDGAIDGTDALGVGLQGGGMNQSDTAVTGAFLGTAGDVVVV